MLTSTEQTGFVQESLFDPLFIEGEVMDDHIDLDDIDDIRHSRYPKCRGYPTQDIH